MTEKNIDRVHTSEFVKPKTNGVLSLMQKPHIRRPIIFGASAVFALQALLLIHFYGIWGLPIHDDWTFSGIAVTYVTGGEFWTDPRLWEYHGSRIILPQLINLADAYLFSWSLVFQMYVGWAFLAGSLILIYLLIRRYGDGRLEYLLIPTAAILFSPHQYPMLLWAHSSVTWTMTLFGFVSCVYCLARVSDSRMWLVLAIISGVAITFSIATGVAVWLIGLVSLVPLAGRGWNHMTPLLIWIASAVVVLTVFTHGYFDDRLFGVEGGESSLLSGYRALEYILSIISSGILYDTMFHVAFGSIMVSVTAVTFVYLYKRGVSYKMIPFVQLFLFGVSSAVITNIGRPDNDPLSSFYVIRGSPAEIAFLVMLAAACMALTGRRRSRAVIILSVILVIIFSFGLAAAYNAAYPEAQKSHQFYIDNIPCVTDMSNIQSHTILCPILRDMKHNTDLRMTDHIPLMSKAELGLYGIYDLHPRSDKLLNHEDWNDYHSGADIKGSISRPLWNVHHPDGLVFDPESPQYVSLSGWSLLENGQKPDAVYVFVGDNIIRKATYGISRSNADSAQQTNSGWYAIVDISTLRGGSPDGKTCHDVMVRVLDGNTYREYTTEQVCIKYNEFGTWGGIDDPIRDYPDWHTGLDPNKTHTVTLTGWTVIQRNFQQPDNIMLLIGDRTYDDITYGLERTEISEWLANNIEYGPGWKITADISDLKTGCHDVIIRIMRGDAYAELATKPLCIA